MQNQIKWTVMFSTNIEIELWRKHFHKPYSYTIRCLSEYRKKNRFKFTMYNNRFRSRIFKIVSEINSGVIFSLLPVNAIFLALTMYNTEHVIIILSNSWNILSKRENFFFLVKFRLGYASFSRDLHNNFHVLAIPFLLLCYMDNFTNFIHWRYWLQLRLVFLSNWIPKIYDFDYCTFTRVGFFHWIWFDSMYIGNFWKSKNFYWTFIFSF